MAVIKLELIQSAPFIAGNVEIVRVSHQNAVNVFLATIADPQDVLALETVLQSLGTNFLYKTAIVYHQP